MHPLLFLKIEKRQKNLPPCMANETAPLFERKQLRVGLLTICSGTFMCQRGSSPSQQTNYSRQ